MGACGCCVGYGGEYELLVGGLSTYVLGLVNSTKCLDWGGGCRYRRGGSESDSDITIADTAAIAALLFFWRRVGSGS